MNRRVFTDEELHVASISAIKSMVQSFPSLTEIDHIFSEEYRTKMDVLLQKIRLKRKFITLSRQIAAVFASMLIGLTAWLSIDTNAQAAFFEWIRETFENSVVYRYFGEKEPDVLPEYELGWLPDGFEEVLNERDDMSCIMYYINAETGDGIGFEYRYLDEGSIALVYSEDELLYEDVYFKESIAKFYPSENKSDASVLLWIDDKKDIVFFINSNLEKSVIISIAEHINLGN